MIERKLFFVVVDGMGDRAVREGKTTLQLAEKPSLDRMAAQGSSGTMNTLGPGIVPGSDTAHLALFGYDPSIYYKGRGALEALGVGLNLEPGDVAFRCNFATVDSNGTIIDRRAGRLKDEGPVLASSLEKLTIDGTEVQFTASTEHRGVLVLRGSGLSSAVSDTDPHSGNQQPPLKSVALVHTPEAQHTAQVLNKFIEMSWKILRENPVNKQRELEGKLPANIVLTRGAGTYEKIDTLPERYGLRACCIAGSALYKGVARYVGMEVITVPGATGRSDTDILAKAQAAREALNSYDFVFVHVKGTDNASHDGDIEGKIKMIAKIDQLACQLENEEAFVVITADHSTPVRLKRHSADPVPVLVYGKGIRRDTVHSFDEIAASSGCIGRLTGLELHRICMDLMGCSHMVGS